MNSTFAAEVLPSTPCDQALAIWPTMSCVHLPLLFAYTLFYVAMTGRAIGSICTSNSATVGRFSSSKLTLRTPLPRTLTFTDPDKIRELARRCEAWGDSESRQMLEHAIEADRGGVFLRLTPDQYARLRQP
jgi:hypothetical protein